MTLWKAPTTLEGSLAVWPILGGIWEGNRCPTSPLSTGWGWSRQVGVATPIQVTKVERADMKALIYIYKITVWSSSKAVRTSYVNNKQRNSY